MIDTSSAPDFHRTADPSRLTPLEIALSRCSWCPTASSDAHDDVEDDVNPREALDEPVAG